MANISSRKNLFNSDDGIIEQFFKETKFRGEFQLLTDEEKSSLDWACGKVINISINGQINDLCPKSLLVPQKYKSYVTSGACEFSAIVDPKALHAKKKIYKLLIVSIKSITLISPNHNEKEENLFRRNLKLDNNRFVGQFLVNSDGSVKICDIRRTDFSKLILQNGIEQKPIVFHPKQFKPVSGRYYEFTWILNASRENYVYLFKVDESQPLKEVTPQDLVKRLHDDIMDYPAGAGQKIVRMLDTLKNQLTASGKEIFIYELLQNANDYPVVIDGIKQSVDVEFHLTLTSLVFMHTGAAFNEKNVAAICSINDKEKDTNKDAIGYKGIGFKTVFLDNEYVYLQTAGFSFRFDKQATRDIVDTPWQILPIWTEYSELTLAEKTIFKRASHEFQVKFALRPTRKETLRSIPQSYAQMFREVFSNERVILFIPNLANVRVYLQGTPVPDIICSRSNNNWKVDDFEESIDESITASINRDIEDQESHGGLKIPTKYLNFRRTKVSFACEVDNETNRIKPVADTCLYCYLPAKEAKWGLKFLMNTDMIPNGPRDNIETEFDNTTNVNEEIARIAGSKLFDWIYKLCSSNLYDYSSIFNLIPEFDIIKIGRERFKALISDFQEGFEVRLKDEAIIPGKEQFINITRTILDKTGLTSSGILTDEKFLQFLNREDVALPHSSLRPMTPENDAFQSFLEKYLMKFDVAENIFDLGALTKMVRTDSFKDWLRNQSNNNQFLKFLLDNGYLQDFLGEQVFIDEVNGELHIASELYYNIDEELKDLYAFKSHLCYLSLETRAFFKDEWDRVIREEFASFDSDREAFINRTLLGENWGETIEALGSWEASYHFYKYLTKSEIIPDKLLDLPFFNDDSQIVQGFKDKFVFLSNCDEKKICSSAWLSSVTFAFVSSEYSEDILAYLKDNARVRDYDNAIIVKEIILSDKHQSHINESQQQSYEVSKDFVRFCYEHSDLFAEGSLKEYALNAFNRDKEESFETYDAHVFFPSKYYDDYSKKEWINSDWIYRLNSDYLSIDSEESVVKAFLEKAFKIKELTADTFYTKIVRPNLTKIFENTSGNIDSDGSKNCDFIEYLDANYHLIFEEKNDGNKFKDFLFFSDDGHYIRLAQKPVYAFNQELDEIIKSDWFPKDFIQLCSRNYGDSKAILAIGAKEYKFGTFFDEIIAKNLESINSVTTSKKVSIAFHTFISEHFTDLTVKQKEKIKGTKVYLREKSTPASTATGHKLLSPNASKLFELRLVEADSLDLIATEDYNLSLNYWESLGNEEFTLSHFTTWITENKDSFAPTLQQEKLNFAFWRWLKDNSNDATLLEVAKELPILLADGSYAQSDTIYFSDAYLGGSKIESLVKRLNNAAHFLSPSYIEAGQDVAQWKEFFSKVGVQYEIVGILIDTIDNRLKSVDDASLIRLITDNREALESHYTNELVKHLHNLRVQAKDGNFYPIGDTILINCDSEEPFEYITIPTQISFSYHKENRLIDDLMQDIKGNRIQSLKEWQQHKIDHYLTLQDTDSDTIRPIHFWFINDLSKIRNSSKESLAGFQHIDQIKVLDRNNTFRDAKDLTVGHIYNPFFDFEEYGVTELEYVSDEYADKANCSEYVGRFFRTIKMHCDFTESDIKHLSIRSCSIYFWTTYLGNLTKSEATKQLDSIQNMVRKHKFDAVSCIPTRNSMKRPSELYYGKEVDKYIDKIEDWENKTPLTNLPEIRISESGSSMFESLPFKKSLDFLDALYALFFFNGKESRTQLLKWMIEDYESSDEQKIQEYQQKIQEYREDKLAIWKNSQGEKVQIKELYALGNRKLEQFFGSNPQIIDKKYFSSETFRKACDILQIKTITEDDLQMEPINDTPCSRYNSDLKLSALIIAGILSSNDWKNIYTNFCTKLSTLKLHQCDSILIKCVYESSISQDLKQFFHKEDSPDFYFVDDIYEALVFLDFVNDFIAYLGIKGIGKDLINQILHKRNNALRIVQKYQDLIVNEEFKAELLSFAPELKDKLVDHKSEDDEDEDEDVTPITRPTFTSSTATQQDEIADSEDNDADNIPVSQNLEAVNEDNYRSANNQSTINRGNIEYGQSEDQPSDISAQYSSTTDEGDSGRESYRKQNQSHDTASQIDDISQTEDIGNSVGGELPAEYDYNSEDEYIGSADNDPAYDGLGSKPTKSRSFGTTRRHPQPSTAAEVDRMRSNPSPLALKSLPPTDEELDILGKINITPEQIADTNYLAQLRLYQTLENRGEVPEESQEAFVRNAADVAIHKLKSGKYIHACSAARGVVYISPSIWNLMLDNNCEIYVYLNGSGSEFYLITSKKELLQLVEKDDVVIKITGKEKVDVVNQLYSGILKGVKGTAYTLIRVASPTNMDAVFAHYVGSIAESNDGNEDPNEY